MASYPELAEAYEKAATADVAPLIAHGTELFALDRAGSERLGELLAEAWTAGAEAAERDETIRTAAGVSVAVREGLRQLPRKPRDS